MSTIAPAQLPTYQWCADDPCTVAEIAPDLLQLLRDANHDADPMLAQLNTALDLNDHTRQLGLALQQQLAAALATAQALSSATA
jgi:hypothetical protein